MGSESENSELEFTEQEVLGQTTGEIALAGSEQFAWTALRLARQARHRVDILSRDLDPPLYDQLPFLDALRALALRSRYSRIRVLLQNGERVQREGHRLLGLYRKLSSKIELRVVHPDFADHPESFLIADETGYLHRRLHERYEGTADFNDSQRARLLGHFFDTVWQVSEADSQLRALSI